MMIQHYYNVPKDGLLQERLFEEFIPAPKECPKEWLSDPYLKEWWLEEWCNEHGVRSGMSVLRVRPSDVMSAASLRKGLLLSNALFLPHGHRQSKHLTPCGNWVSISKRRIWSLAIAFLAYISSVIVILIRLCRLTC
jgi:hypothetical protein